MDARTLKETKSAIRKAMKEKASTGYPGYGATKRTSLSEVALRGILNRTEFQFDTVKDRELVAKAVVDSFGPRTAKWSDGFFRPWSKYSEANAKRVLDKYVDDSRERMVERATEIKAFAVSHLSPGTFDEAAVLQILKGNGAQELAQDLKRDVATHIVSLLMKGEHPHSLETRKAVSDFGLDGQKDAVIAELQGWERGMRNQREYPYQALEVLYGQIRSAFAVSIPENQDEIIAAVESFEKELNSREVLQNFGLGADSKIWAPITLINELKTAKASAQNPWSAPATQTEVPAANSES